MLIYVARRIGQGLFVLLGITLVTFSLTHLVPGDPARLLAGAHATAAEVATLSRQFGLEGSLPQQYWEYLTQLLHGNLGMSLTTRQPVLQNLATFFPNTVELAIGAIFVMLVLGLPLGMLAARYEGGSLDAGVRLLSTLGASVPVFWLGLILQVVFFEKLGWLPIGGVSGPNVSPPHVITGVYLIDAFLTLDWGAVASGLQHLILPAFTLGIGGVAIIARQMRSAALDATRAPFVRTARAYGLTDGEVMVHHVFRNALVPTTTVLGLQVGYVLSGTLLTEVVFNWPGIGLYAVNAILNLDYPAIMGVTLLIAFVYVMVNLLVDLAYMYLDPRVRQSIGQRA